MEKLMSNGFNHLEVKENYIVPPDKRPQMSEVSHSCTIPVIDLTDLEGPLRKKVVDEIRQACEEYGFFQIVNHGVPETVMKSMMDIGKEFFEMPVEDRASLYSEDPVNHSGRVFTSFNITKDKVLNWNDSLRQHCHPLEEVIHTWPEKPAAYREVAANYAKETRALILRLLAAISEAMGLDPDYLDRIFGKHSQVMVINYYPPCPNPELTFGLPGHSDARGITVLMQDVSGLQVLKDEKWVAVEPIPNAFVVNLADQVQVVSNGRFKSAEHRAVTNKSTARMSIPTFYGPSSDAFISPADSMVDEEHPALYRGYKFEEYSKSFYNQGLNSKSIMDKFKIKMG